MGRFRGSARFLARRRLLPQAHGFESFLAVEEDPDPSDSPAGEVVDIRAGNIAAGRAEDTRPGAKTARSSRRAGPKECQNAVGTDRLQPFDHEMEVGERVAEVRKQTADRIRALVDALNR